MTPQKSAPVNAPVLGSFFDRLFGWLSLRQDLALVGMLVATILMLILPIPTVLADVLIASNIGMALVLMMVAVYVRSPVEFSTLPVVVLLTTAFRLSLSITTSRLVLTQGDAGDIIHAFGEFVIAGNVVVGLVVYLIITIVQFVVITKGSERVAEVAARFTLDALPGKQISIDTDLRNGDIDATEARRRRRLLERESQLYGALDGAMKFVKGDAIASLVIIVVNLVGGIAIGCVQRGLPFSTAVDTYSLLAVGDGLIAQIPALLISLTVGVIVTRAASDQGGNLGEDILQQVVAQPRTLQIAAVVLSGLGFVPGFPTAVFLTLGGTLGGVGWLLVASRRKEAARDFAAAGQVKSAPEAVSVDIYLGDGLAMQRSEIEALTEAARVQVADELGIPVPRLKVAERAGLSGGQWRIEIDGVPAAIGATDPAEQPAAVLAARARDAVLKAADQLLGIQETQALLNRMEQGYGDLVREATKAAPLPRLAELLRRLVDEQVSLRTMRPVLEAVAEWGPRETNAAALAEHVRTALRRQICNRWVDESRTLHALVIEGGLEEALRAAANRGNERQGGDPALAERLAAAIRSQAAAASFPPVVLVAGDLRRSLRMALVRRDIMTPVLAHHEVAPDIAVQVVGTMRQVTGKIESNASVTPLRHPVADAAAA